MGYCSRPCRWLRAPGPCWWWCRDCARLPPTDAAEAAFALVEIAAAASDDTEGPLAQLGAAPEVTPEAVDLGVTLRNLLSQAAATADQLAEATCSS